VRRARRRSARDRHDRQGLHGARPLIEEDEIEAGETREQREPPTVESIGDNREGYADAGPRAAAQPRRIGFVAELETAVQSPKARLSGAQERIGEAGDRLNVIDQKFDDSPGPGRNGPSNRREEVSHGMRSLARYSASVKLRAHAQTATNGAPCWQRAVDWWPPPSCRLASGQQVDDDVA